MIQVMDEVLQAMIPKKLLDQIGPDAESKKIGTGPDDNEKPDSDGNQKPPPQPKTKKQPKTKG